ncbi:MAG TPA: energy transducer TonB [Pyrinomonadaceae bacterium]|nr:energy transducer TonB [Pyrinomonadaceae bacterium]
MFQSLIRGFGAGLIVITIGFTATAQSNLTAKSSLQPPAAAVSNDSDRVRDGLAGPARRVRTEVVKVSNATGKVVEDNKRVLLETAEYDVKGAKTQNQYFPVAGATLTGRETYKYDDKGNISEMTLLNADGSLLSKEIYKYEFDSVGNWVKMITSVAVVENQKIEFEPTEITYRTISYYLDASVAKLLQPGPSANGAAASVNPPPAQLPPASMNVRVASVQLPNANLATSNSTNSQKVGIDGEAPPPRILKPISGGVLNGKALSLPVPTYPQFAARAHTSGKVEVEVVVDESGKVLSAQAVSGPASLREAAVDAAKRARFSPTKLSGAPVKVVGLINYNFNLP